MHRTSPDQMIRAYLDRVSNELQDLPGDERAEIIDDLRQHIEEALGSPEEAGEAEVRNVLDRLGQPAAVAAEARSRHDDHDGMVEDDQRPPENPEPDRTPGALEVGAIILTALFWPVGLLLTWISQRWKTRDKVVATVLPVVGTFGMIVITLGGMVAYGSGSVGSVVTMAEDQPAESSGPVLPEPRDQSEFSDSTTGEGAGFRMLVVFGFLAGVLAAPFVAAIYLAVRLQPARRNTPPAHSQHLNQQALGSHW